MLHFEKLAHLTANIHTLQEIFQQENLFLVGGAMRNILLGIEEYPHDIDVTGVGHPDDLRNTIDKEKYSAFRTEKYGTITVIPEKKECPDEQVQYELTPFRSEDNYTDNRHPDEIQRSDSLLDDSKRRDFSINSLYYTQINYASLDKVFQFPKDPRVSKHQTDITPGSNNNENLIKYLGKDGVLFFSNLKLLIVSNPDIIEKLINQGEVNPAVVQYLLNTTKNINFVTQSLPRRQTGKAKSLATDTMDSSINSA